MERLLKKLQSDGRLGALFVANFIFSFHFFLLVYFFSSFLNERGVEERLLGVVYIASSLLSILGMMLFPRALKVFGNYKSIVALIIAGFFAYIGFALIENIWVTIGIAILSGPLFPLAILSLDIFLENNMTDESMTGSIRGSFLTTTNIALILAPLVGGFIINEQGFGALYLVSATFLIPFFIIIARYLHSFKDPSYEGI